MSGQWPPEWEDPDDGHSDAGLPDGLPPDAGYPGPDGSEVTSFLASVPSGALPAAFEARISAAIAAEAAARATSIRAEATGAAGEPIAAAGADGAKTTVRSIQPEDFSPADAAGGSATPATRKPRRSSRASRRAAGASGPGPSRPDGRRRRLRMPSMQATGWVVVCCLVIAGFGFLVTHSGSSSSSSVAESAPAAGAVPSAASRSSATHDQPDLGTLPGRAGAEPETSASAPGFLYTETGTRYERSALAGQVRSELGADGFGTPGAATPGASSGATPASSASATAAPASSAIGGYVPSPQLEGCVFHLTGNVAPSLVDRASYDGTPAYIIAVPTRVWVVGLGCTATDSHLITQLSLTA